MILQTYKDKRNFKQTPEPSGAAHKSRADALVFVVQKHAASHLHFDFRLEAEGVLKSWAVPKGPSLDASVKRLAMMVEDHPFDYRNFEGIIPEGNYGAGTVMVWDQGVYFADPELDREENEELILAGLTKGKVVIFMQGKKLRGWFTLVRTRGPKGNEWLLMKKDDEYTGDDEEVSQDSVVSGRSMAEIAGSSNGKHHAKQKPAAKAKVKLTTGKISPMPASSKAMLATLTDAPFDRTGWIFEIKWDGYRTLADIRKGKVRLYSRNDLNFNKHFPAIAKALEAIRDDVILDGEVVILDREGKSSFQKLQNYMNTGEGELVFFVFDILYWQGRDLTGLPLIERKKLLVQALPDLPNVRVSEYVEDEGERFFAAARENGLEGIIAKKANSIYEEGRRSRHWLKIKIVQEQEAIICGYTEPSGSRKYFGSLVLGVYGEQGDLQYIGHVGGGFDFKGLRAMFDRLKPLTTSKCPFPQPPKGVRAKWVKPQLVCQVKFGEWTQEGSLRQPIFLGLREDKPAKDVRREMAKPAQALVQAETPKRVYGIKKSKDASAGPALTNTDKIFWPKEKYTKGDVIEYYRTIAPYILPYLQDRPQSLNRHPNGIEGDHFFQKDVQGKVEEWVKTVPVFSESNDKKIHYLICNDSDTLLYLANLGCIELNVWNAHVPTLDTPDYTVLDFDPEDIAFREVVEAVLVAHQILDKIDVEHYVKTSGSTGLHIYIPLGGKYTHEQSKEFALLINTLVHRRLPKTTSLERSPAKRQRKVYLDYLQNREAQTMAAPYSLRPKPGAPVSTPLKWPEVTPKLDPSAFNIRTIMKRLDKLGDLWKPMLRTRLDMNKALSRLEKVYREQGAKL